jgi:alpha-1,3-mannosyltransferase
MSNMVALAPLPIQPASHRPPAARRVPGEQSRAILGIRIRVMTAACAISELDERIQLGEPSRVAFLNANLANTIVKDVVLKENISSFLVLNDGIGIDMASLLLHGKTFPENLVGTDFVPRYLTETRHRLRLALVGGTDEVIRRVVNVMMRKWPQHEVGFWHHGYFDRNQETAIAQAIAQAGCNVALVAMGNPRQEQWIGRNVPDACAIGFGVGALFDYLAGAVPRAPPFILRWRLEWVYRLMAEPRRLWRRYLIGNFVFVFRVACEWSKRRVSW